MNTGSVDSAGAATSRDCGSDRRGDPPVVAQLGQAQGPAPTAPISNWRTRVRELMQHAMRNDDAISPDSWSGGKTIELNEDVDGDGQKVTLNLRFPGQYYDEESGLHYNWHRYYDPETGRYISIDAILLMPEVITDNKYYDGFRNVYAYALNNPITFFDITGIGPWREGGFAYAGHIAWEAAAWLCPLCGAAKQVLDRLKFLDEMLEVKDNLEDMPVEDPTLNSQKIQDLQRI